MFLLYQSVGALSSIVAQVLMNPPHQPCVPQAMMFVNLEKPFHLSIYVQKVAHALTSSESI
jgi:hypothetical protein